MTPTKRVQPSAQMVRARKAMIEAMRKEAATMPAEEVLAVAAYTVGQLIAMQDQRRFTPATIMKLVEQNIEQGNADAIAQVASVGGTPQ